MLMLFPESQDGKFGYGDLGMYRALHQVNANLNEAALHKQSARTF